MLNVVIHRHLHLLAVVVAKGKELSVLLLCGLRRNGIGTDNHNVKLSNKSRQLLYGYHVHLGAGVLAYALNVGFRQIAFFLLRLTHCLDFKVNARLVVGIADEPEVLPVGGVIEETLKASSP